MTDVQTNTTATVQQASHGEDASIVGKLLSPDPGVMLWVWVVFFVLLVVLKKFAWKPILSGIEAREKSLKDSLSRAEEVARKTEAAEDEQRKILDQAKADAAQILSETRDFAKDIKVKAEADAKAQSERIVAQAKQEIDAAQQKAQAQLRHEAAVLSIGVAEKILRKSLNSEEDKAYAERMVQETSRS